MLYLAWVVLQICLWFASVQKNNDGMKDVLGSIEEMLLGTAVSIELILLENESLGLLVRFLLDDITGVGSSNGVGSCVVKGVWPMDGVSDLVFALLLDEV